MKQRFIYAIILLLSISCASALDVELGVNPQNDHEVDENDLVNFECYINEISEATSITLELTKGGETNTIINSSLQSQFSSLIATFSKEMTVGGMWNWTCYADSTTEHFTSLKSRILIVNAQNTPPTISPEIPNQEKNIDLSSWVYDLSIHANDNEDLSSNLIWEVSGVDTSFCNVEIISGDVASFTPSSSTSPGSDTITFTLTDTGGLTDTQDITITLTSTTCTEDWECTDWSSCTDDEQTRTCTDNNDCGTTDDKPSESRSCNGTCTEDWECTVWSACEDGYKTRDCADDNDCGTTDDKPSESISCSAGSYVLEITSSTPSSSTLTMNKGTSKVFRININLVDANIKWYLDNILQSDKNQDFRFTPTSTGTYTIKVIVEKDSDKDAKEWEITVGNVTTISVNESTCGNNETDEGEDCLTCPSDIPCQENELCDEGICKQKSNLITGYVTKITDSIKDKWYYFSIILGLVILTIIGLIVNSRIKKDSHPLAEFGDKKSVFGGLRRKLRELDRKRHQKKTNKANIRTLQKSKKDEIAIVAPAGIDSITSFINESRSNGYSERQIIKALKNKGWSRKHVKLAFQKLKK